MCTVITEFFKNMNVWRQEQHTNLTTHIYIYIYASCFYISITKEVSVEEMKLIYLNMKGLPNIDRFKCLRNDINIMSADVICISNTNTTSSDNLSVILKEFDIIYNTQELVNDKSMGMIIYKKQHIDLVSVQ